MAGERAKLVPAVHLLLVKDGRVLLSRRFNTGWEDGKWSVPAGHVDQGETVTEAMAREVREETGILVNKDDLLFLHVMHRRSSGERSRAENDRVDFFFTADRWQGEPNIMESHKCDAMEWFPIDALPPDTVAYVRAGIEHAFKKKPFSEFGWNGRR